LARRTLQVPPKSQDEQSLLDAKTKPRVRNLIFKLSHLQQCARQPESFIIFKLTRKFNPEFRFRCPLPPKCKCQKGLIYTTSCKQHS
jgi:hypothetical protein